MANESTYFLETFQNQLSIRYHEEKHLIKIVQQLYEAAQTAELRKALSPVETGSDVHLERLGQILKRLKIKKSKTGSKTVEALIGESKLAAGRKNKPSLEKDLDILIFVKRIQHQRIANFQLMHLMSVSLTLDFETSLLEQCLAEHQNTDAYLSQVAQNVLFPQLHKPTLVDTDAGL